MISNASRRLALRGALAIAAAAFALAPLHASAADKVLRAYDKQVGKRTDRKGH